MDTVYDRHGPTQWEQGRIHPEQMSAVPLTKIKNRVLEMRALNLVLLASWWTHLWVDCVSKTWIIFLKSSWNILQSPVCTRWCQCQEYVPQHQVWRQAVLCVYFRIKNKQTNKTNFDGFFLTGEYTNLLEEYWGGGVKKSIKKMITPLLRNTAINIFMCFLDDNVFTYI